MVLWELGWEINSDKKHAEHHARLSSSIVRSISTFFSIDYFR